MKTTEFKLTFRVRINLNGETPEEIRQNLIAIACDALNWGNVTGEGPATVEDYSIQVWQIKKKGK